MEYEDVKSLEKAVEQTHKRITVIGITLFLIAIGGIIEGLSIQRLEKQVRELEAAAGIPNPPAINLQVPGFEPGPQHVTIVLQSRRLISCGFERHTP